MPRWPAIYILDDLSIYKFTKFLISLSRRSCAKVIDEMAFEWSMVLAVFTVNYIGPGSEILFLKRPEKRSDE